MPDDVSNPSSGTELDFLKAAEAQAADGTLNRLASLVAELPGIEPEEARELIGGLLQRRRVAPRMSF